ncbi:uncharacterized protein LOC117339511 [Pecten maximus]|uniref:uncharacterized protein LOC117339511 n=1 Tax=Pecten maximus TaxID=6579 RepID=UPI001458FFE7|nr:uncharacterized protein LOC117339511 [Pecten maximus]
MTGVEKHDEKDNTLISGQRNKTNKMTKVKRGARKLYTFSTPYSQSTISQSATNSNPLQQTRTQGNDKGHFFDLCDVLDEVVSSDRQENKSQSNKQTRLTKKARKEGPTEMKVDKYKLTTSAIVVDGLGIAVHQKSVSASSPKKAARAVEKKMMRLKVLGTIFKMKQELDILRERRLKLAKKLRTESKPQEE